MRIIIETDEGEQRLSVQPETARSEQAGALPPEDLAARAEAMGAASAGPAPAEAGVEGPSQFVQIPGTPETAPEAQGPAEAASAGGAPDFASGPLELQEVEPET